MTTPTEIPTIYLAAGGEVDEKSTMHLTMEDAMKKQCDYIDVFFNGKHVETFKLIDAGYSNDSRHWYERYSGKSR